MNFYVCGGFEFAPILKSSSNEACTSNMGPSIPQASLCFYISCRERRLHYIGKSHAPSPIPDKRDALFHENLAAASGLKQSFLRIITCLFWALGSNYCHA